MSEKKLKLDKSIELFKKAMKLLPAGVSSNARLWQDAQFSPSLMPSTIFAKKAKGAYIWDIDGNKYIDYRLGFGPVILGHSYPAVVREIHKHEMDGSVFAFDNELEIKVAEKIIDAVPCAEMVRYSVTGTEATMHAIRLARAYTKKKVIMKFEGHYHGAHDYLLFSTQHVPIDGAEKPHMMSQGIPEEIKKLILVANFNDFEDVEKKVKKYHKKIAAIILEPIMGNGGGITPASGFLKFLKELCERYGILLIFDEVKTGFRVSYGGAQKLYKVTPHLATFAKSISNGYPLSAITGEEEIMKLFGPGTKKVTHGGTYASNPISMIAANATLDVLKKSSTFRKLNSYGKSMMRGVEKSFRENNLQYSILGVPTMFNFGCTHLNKISFYRDFRKTCDTNMYSRIHFELMKEGVMIDEDDEECIYISLSHGKKELEKTIEAFRNAVARAKVPRTPISRFKLQL